MIPAEILAAGLILLTSYFVYQGQEHMRAAIREPALDAPSSAFLIAPLFLFQPRLFNETGEVHRRAALRALLGLVVCAGLVLAAFG